MNFIKNSRYRHGLKCLI